MDQFLGETVSKWGNHFLFKLFNISFMWAFQQYITRPYLINTHFWPFYYVRPILGKAEIYFNDDRLNAPKILVFKYKFIQKK